MSFLLDVIIPTFNNREYLMPCLKSLFDVSAPRGLYRAVVVNNGDEGSLSDIPQNEYLKTIEAGRNLWWEGGLKRGIEESDSPYVMFLNDDTFVPLSNGYWVNKMLRHFVDPKVAAVGPSSNVVMGIQSIFSSGRAEFYKVSFLIGFCMLLKREALMKAGGIDDALPHHGDDIDLSIRLRAAGFDLIADKTVFVFHHGFKTGQRVEGAYWNSAKMQEKTNNQLIRKHGLETWFDTISRQELQRSSFQETEGDAEGCLVRRYVEGENVLELGCGAQKTVPHAIGIDRIPKGSAIPTIDARCIADVQGDVEKTLPFSDGFFDTVIARHILEHSVDTLGTLENWRRVIKPGGRLIIAVPDETRAPTIPMNLEHLHAFTPETLRKIMKAAGFEEIVTEDAGNYLSFVGVYKANGLH